MLQSIISMQEKKKTNKHKKRKEKLLNAHRSGISFAKRETVSLAEVKEKVNSLMEGPSEPVKPVCHRKHKIPSCATIPTMPKPTTFQPQK
ncbi:hypothetical protein CEXT_108171 [Caerostris extrusa]|uniref:Uncharacterized protein n=1 Tax=Caerostris extrusa TaxID=172846 RepID=A0AAV4S096_CAEEX|nr:hypothetical protein CEXT_108171 [Caerostris extrusa]